MTASSDPHDVVNERTRLLSVNTDPENVDTNKFHSVTCHPDAVNTSFGPGPESQQPAMVREPQKYADVQRAQVKAKSPYLAGVSVGRFWLIFGVILTSYFIACFDATLMVSSHPVITSYFHSSNSASWLSTAFLVSSTGFQSLFGGLSDTIGRKPPYICSLFFFLIATVWCGLAQSMTSFIIARAVCGLGAGGLITMSSIITSDLVPIEIRGIYQSYINIIFGVGSASGAALGGWIADSLGWRWEFGIQVPTLVICLIVSTLTLPRKLGLNEGVEKKSIWEAMKVFDIKGSVLFSTSIIFLVLGLNLGGNIYPWGHPLVIASFAIFMFSFPLFVYVESYIANPIMPLRIFLKNPRGGLIVANGLAATIINFVIFNTPLFFQAVMLESATSSGLRMLVPSIATSLAGTAVGFLITWTKQLKIFLVIGLLVTLIGCVGLSFLHRGLPSWACLLFLVPSSVGQGLSNPTTFMAVLSISHQSEQAVVTSMLVLWRSIGMVFGVAVSSLILQNSLVFYLNRYVSGPERDHVIEAVRKSVAVIQNLDPWYREQVQDSYAAALRLTFAGAAVLSLICFILTVSLKVPRLGRSS